MTNEQIIEAAAKMGIKPARATVGRAWERWADRVRQAACCDYDLLMCDRLLGNPDRRDLYARERDIAIAQANRLAA